ncbi:hypothetical protein TNCV_1883521 [Trichonephila clavipes]|nr:hypothetical protein TNCV_1883521 [Trichonephila clavipes]
MSFDPNDFTVLTPSTVSKVMRPSHTLLNKKQRKKRCHRMIDDGSSPFANGRKEPSRDDLVEGESARALCDWGNKRSEKPFGWRAGVW